MLIELYIFLSAVNVLFIILSWLKRDVLIFLWIPVILSFSLAISSFNLEYVFCEAGNVTINEWSCYVYSKNDFGMNMLWFGFGLVCLAYAIIMTITQPAEAIK